MATNDTNDMQRMQQDAIRRVQEMHSRAQQTVNQSPIPPIAPEPTSQRTPAPSSHSIPGHNQPPRPPRPPEPMQHQAPPLIPPPPLQEPPLANLFDGLLQDSERTLILVLILILVSEKADTGLIFAMMYLII